jgi:predicted transposase YbfD/YdcC
MAPAIEAVKVLSSVRAGAGNAPRFPARARRCPVDRQVQAPRETSDGRVQSETRWFALSWLPTPEVLQATVRAHWAIENALHRQLDVSFREDGARNRKDNGPDNIAVLRRRALDVVRREGSKSSLSIKLKRAGWDDEFLLSLLKNLPEG